MYATASLLTISGSAPEQWGSRAWRDIRHRKSAFEDAKNSMPPSLREFPRDKNTRVS
ncbi:hypothetical protein M2275_007410 [Rhodococcus opacus]|nr:hypothetical protein [Rhodococcus opacus]